MSGRGLTYEESHNRAIFVTARILHIIDSLRRGGTEKQLTLLACGMKRAGWDVRVCCLAHDGPLREPLDTAGVPVEVIGRKWPLDPGAYRRLRRYIAESRPDVVHTWNFVANGYGRQAAASCGVKHVVAGEYGVDTWKHGYHTMIDRYLAGRTRRFTTNSVAVVDFHAKLGLPREKFVVIPNGIEPFTSPANNDREAFLRELGIKSSARLIGTVGVLHPRKRLKDLIWSQELTKVLHEDAHVVIVGDGPQRAQLERYARTVTNFRDEQHVHFLGHRDDVPRILSHLDAFALVSGGEGQSTALLEAMSAGVPVIATDLPGHRDLVVPGRTGFLTAVGDRAGIASAANDLLSSRELSQRLGNAGREHVLREFSVERMVERYMALYERIIA